jgi:hypothetical protein
MRSAICAGEKSPLVFCEEEREEKVLANICLHQSLPEAV